MADSGCNSRTALYRRLVNSDVLTFVAKTNFNRLLGRLNIKHTRN